MFAGIERCLGVPMGGSSGPAWPSAGQPMKGTVLWAARGRVREKSSAERTVRVLIQGEHTSVGALTSGAEAPLSKWAVTARLKPRAKRFMEGSRMDAQSGIAWRLHFAIPPVRFAYGWGTRRRMASHTSGAKALFQMGAGGTAEAVPLTKLFCGYALCVTRRSWSRSRTISSNSD
jgi:hypothetical protein